MGQLVSLGRSRGKKRGDLRAFLPTTREEMEARGWDELDILIVSGDADLWSPPPVQRHFLRHLPRAEGVVIPESGHSAYWEQPDAFNAALLGFLSRQR